MRMPASSATSGCSSTMLTVMGLASWRVSLAARYFASSKGPRGDPGSRQLTGRWACSGSIATAWSLRSSESARSSGASDRSPDFRARLATRCAWTRRYNGGEVSPALRFLRSSSSLRCASISEPLRASADSRSRMIVIGHSSGSIRLRSSSISSSSTLVPPGCEIAVRTITWAIPGPLVPQGILRLTPNEAFSRHRGVSAQRVARGERRGEEQHGAGLVGGGERDRHDQEQGGDTEGDLQERHRQKGVEGAAAACGKRMTMGGEPEGDDRGHARQRQQAVIELNGGDVLEEIAPPGLQLPIALGDETAVHQREGIVGETGIEPGDEAAGEQGQEDERDNRRRRARQQGGRQRPRRTRPEQVERCPQDRGIDDDGKAEMGDEPVLADLDAVDETALDHDPAEHALEPAEHENADQPRHQTGRDATAEQAPQEGRGKGDYDQAGPQAVQPLPEEERLEVRQAHPGMHELELRDRPIFGEFRLPCGFAQRRQYAGDRLPFGDR